MTTKTIFAILFLCSFGLAQHVTYSVAEDTGFHRLNMSFGKAKTVASLATHKALIDSIRYFLAIYPRSIYKSALFSYLLDLTSDLPSGASSAKTMADSVLAYDSLSVTRLRVGEILLNQNIDLERGEKLVTQAFPTLTYWHHRYRAHRLLAQYDISHGRFSSAEFNIRQAIKIDSSRYDAWFDYLAFSRMREDLALNQEIRRRISSLEQADILQFNEESQKGPLIFRSLSTTNLHSNNDKIVSLNKQGRVQVVNFFAFWCSACTGELQDLEKLTRAFPQVLFRFVNTDTKPDPVHDQMLRKEEFRFLRSQSLLYGNDAILTEIGLRAIPRTLIIDKKGVIRSDYLGYPTNGLDLFRQRILQLLAE